jgi:EmrB/QacA subfamily drug resistance transporter
MPEANNNTINKNVALFVTTLSAFLTTFMASSINIALPSIAKEFSTDTVVLGWIATAYILTASVFLVPFGKLADIYGRKKIYALGIIVYAISSFITAIAPDAMTLIIARALQGIGGSMIFGTAIAILTSAFPANERGKVLGYNLASTYLGLSLGPVIGGILTHQFGWRSVFLACVILSCILIPIVIWKLKAEWTETKGEKFDLFGSFIYMISLLSIMYGFSILPSLKGIIILCAGIILFFVFLKIQNKVKYPILELSNFKRNTVFVFSNIAAFINYSATFALGYLLSLYLQYIKGLNPQEAGFLLLAQPIAMTLFSPVAGRLSDKIEPQIVASMGMALTVFGLIPFIFLDNGTSNSYIIITLFVIGIGFALFSSPNTNAIMSSVDRKYYGVASASVGTMRLTGQTISMGIASMIFGIQLGKVKITQEYFPQFIQSIHILFIIFTILCSLGVFASLARGKLR